ncbi:hypothetical protein GUITHDRAFT_133306 [Guillardia theta CCMP2712]|uniref:Uncharacterized protein n=1 Tax=Guillardia theta (strain CCMP2712) TaxID=905079 RepID=L1JWF1_GUITC|nr:hypothetical protein GUITHDRAFT_133306 [Guillardia theta CCMP2712]EKX52896.1 hypothetical protein GUITHDRAFT_133306 [Guillardia theta CCMP2712]|eukprot:XP_005839876.1 hypothetical protein GUITHDRAFT_133306 [Guillardia theta CCMP2712]
MDKSEDNHVSLDSEDFKELPETYEKYRLLGLKEKEPPVMNDEIVEYKDTNLFQEFPKENVHMSPRDPDESERESATCLELFPAEHGDKDEAPMQRTDLQDANPEQFVGHGVSRESENKEEAQEHQTKHRQRRAQPRDRGRHEQVDEESRVGVSAHLVKCEACAELSYVRTIIDQITESLRSGQLQDVEKNLSPQTRNKTAKKLQELSSLVLQATGGLSYQSSPLQRAHQDILEQYSALERESEHLRDELSFSKKERQYLSSEVSRLTSRMQTLESSIMRLQMECSQKEEALRNLSGNDLSNDGRLSHPLKSSVSPSVSPSIPRFNDSCDSARKQLDKPAFGLHVEESAPNFGLSPQSHVTPRHSSTSPYADALTSRKDPPFSPDSEAKRKEKINYAMLC